MNKSTDIVCWNCKVFVEWNYEALKEYRRTGGAYANPKRPQTYLCPKCGKGPKDGAFRLKSCMSDEEQANLK